MGADGAMSGDCLEPLPLGPDECDLVFMPSFDAFYDDVIAPTCAVAGTSCHGSAGMQGGMDLSEREMAYDTLLGNVDGRARVMPGDPECSLMVQRLQSDDPGFQMPPLAKLSPEQRCSIISWVAAGAVR